MAPGLELNVGMRLEQKLSPQMIQSLKLLQVTALQLDAMITQELEENPLLEKSEEEIEDVPDEGDGAAKKTEEDFDELNTSKEKEEVDWEAFFDDGFDPGFKKSEETNPDRFERVPVNGKTLQDHLRSQLQYKRIAPEVVECIEYLLECLNDDGYLTLENAPTSEEGGENPLSPAPIEDNLRYQEILDVISGVKDEPEASKPVREAFHILRRLEPIGVGARNLRECLLIQAFRVEGFSTLGIKILQDHFDLFKNLKISALAKELGVEAGVIQNTLREIGALEPRPGRLITDSVSTPIIPDLLVEIVEGEILLLFNDKFSPSLRVSRNYSDLIRKGSKASSETKKYVREKLNSASWLIRAIEQRKTTMMKVMRAIINSQPDFFSKGPTHLKPLILQDIADQIDMHISTVSRVINGKYVQTPSGIFELKYFFTSGVAQGDGTDVSSLQIKDKIKALIENEDPKKPISDQKLANILKTGGLEVARRTIAKYRDQLSILPARLRKQF